MPVPLTKSSAWLQMKPCLPADPASDADGLFRGFRTDGIRSWSPARQSPGSPDDGPAPADRRRDHARDGWANTCTISHQGIGMRAGPGFGDGSGSRLTSSTWPADAISGFVPCAASRQAHVYPGAMSLARIKRRSVGVLGQAFWTSPFLLDRSRKRQRPARCAGL